MGKQRSVVVAGGVVLLVVLAGCGTSATEPASVPSRSGVPTASTQVLRSGVSPRLTSYVVNQVHPSADPSPAELHDLRAYAEQSGKDPDVVIRKHAGQAAFDDAMSAVKQRYGSSVAVAGFDEGDTGGLFIRFTRRPGDDLPRLLRKVPGPVRIEYGAPLTEQQQSDLSERAMGLATGFPGVRTAGTGVLPIPGLLTVTVVPEDDGVDAPALLRRLAALDPRFPVELRVDPDYEAVLEAGTGDLRRVSPRPAATSPR